MATDVVNAKKPEAPVTRAGTVEVDLSVVGALRAYQLAADEFAAAKKRMEDARSALDAAAGDHEVITFGGEPIFSFKETARRTVDIDRLAERYPEVFADVATVSMSYRLTIDQQTRHAVRSRTWRAAVRKRTP